jgi:hypothetical protein
VDASVDLTYLKAFMHERNLHQGDYMGIFKRINDLAALSKFQGGISKENFESMFTNKALDQEQNMIASKEPPSMQEIVDMFMLLDEDRQGMIETKKVKDLLKNTILLKEAKFELDTFQKKRGRDLSQDPVLRHMEQ